MAKSISVIFTSFCSRSLPGSGPLVGPQISETNHINVQQGPHIALSKFGLFHPCGKRTILCSNVKIFHRKHLLLCSEADAGLGSADQVPQVYLPLVQHLQRKQANIYSMYKT